MAALALVGAIMTACAGSDDTVADTPPQPENTGKVVTLTTTVSLDDGGADTRALTANGVKTFAAGETMALVYRNKSNKRTVKESEPLTADNIAADGKSATFTFNLTEEPNKTESVYYIYPAAMAMADGNENYEALCTEQDGTLTKLASNFDLATTNNLDWDGDNLPGATLANQLAVLAITLKDDATGADITGSITGLTLTARNNSHTESMTYNITRSAAAGPIYVAIHPTMFATINVTATGGAYTYTKTLEAKVYKASNGYNVSWRMTNKNTVPLTMEALTAGTIGVQTPVAAMKYSVDGGSMTNISHGPTKTISVNAGDKVQFYGNSNYYYTNDSFYNNIAGGTAQVKVYGNIMSLVGETDFATNTTLPAVYTFALLFKDNTTLTDASGLLLPATTLSVGCYAAMFENCTNLTIAPVLPAEITASHSPSRTRRVATTTEEFFFCRTASAGCSSIPTTSSA